MLPIGCVVFDEHVSCGSSLAYHSLLGARFEVCFSANPLEGKGLVPIAMLGRRLKFWRCICRSVDGS